jgi:hypothetical protein
MCASSSGRAEAFFLASGAALSQEVANVKMNVQSACTLNTVYQTWYKASELQQTLTNPVTVNPNVG